MDKPDRENLVDGVENPVNGIENHTDGVNHNDVTGCGDECCSGSSPIYSEDVKPDNNIQLSVREDILDLIVERVTKVLDSRYQPLETNAESDLEGSDGADATSVDEENDDSSYYCSDDASEYEASDTFVCDKPLSRSSVWMGRARCRSVDSLYREGFADGVTSMMVHCVVFLLGMVTHAVWA